MQLSQRNTNNLLGVHPLLVSLIHTAIQHTPIDFTITEGIRTTSRQQALFAQGRNGDPRPIVTQIDGVTRKSKHQVQDDGYGHAIDIYPFINGKVDVHAVKELKVIAKHILSTANEMKIPVVWGGSWKRFKDYLHFELRF